MKKSLRRALWAGAVVAVAAAAVPMVQASAAAPCAPAWSASTVYLKDNSVSYQNKNYVAKWWTQNEVPTASGEWGVWKDAGACGGSTPDPTKPPTDPTKPPTDPTKPPTDPTKPPTDPTNPPSGDKWVVGYFAEWGVYARNFHVKNLVTSGSADKTTHILYSFANTAGGRCAIGDAYASTDKAYDAATSVDGVADTWDQGALRGSFNQLLKLKKKYPHIKVLYSVGGWNWSAGFSDAAKNPQAFADSCYNLLEDPRWPGLFDGIDIDWEFPQDCGGDANTCDNSGYNAYRDLLGAVRAKFGQNYLVTSAITADARPGGKLDKANYAEGINQHLNKVFLMTYDFFGGWAKEGPTAPHSPLTSYPGIPTAGFTSEAAVQWLRSKGVPASKIALGVPFYGRGWTGVTQEAPGGKASGPATGSWPGGDGVADYKDLKSNKCAGANIKTVAGTAYALCSGGNWWGFDTPATIGAKTKWASQQGLGGVFFWEFSGDTPNGELISAIKSNL